MKWKQWIFILNDVGDVQSRVGKDKEKKHRRVKKGKGA